jgi:hypothetical protein
VAYYYRPFLFDEGTSIWLEEQTYLKSQMVFYAAPIFPDWMSYWHYAVRDTRDYYNHFYRKDVE